MFCSSFIVDMHSGVPCVDFLYDLREWKQYDLAYILLSIQVCLSFKRANIYFKSCNSRYTSIGFESLNRYKKVDVKIYDLFLTEWLKRNFSYLAKILPLDFSKILNVI